MIDFTKQDVGGNLAYLWENIPSGEQCRSALHTGTADRTVQVEGTFGGATVTLEGSIDNQNWHTLHDTFGVSLSFSAPGLRAVLENAVYLRPAMSGGDGTTAVSVYLNVRR